MCPLHIWVHIIVLFRSSSCKAPYRNTVINAAIIGMRMDTWLPSSSNNGQRGSEDPLKCNSAFSLHTVITQLEEKSVLTFLPTSMQLSEHHTEMKAAALPLCCLQFASCLRWLILPFSKVQKSTYNSTTWQIQNR